MKRSSLVLLLAAAVSTGALAHTPGPNAPPMDKEALRQHIADEFMAKRAALAKAGHVPLKTPLVTKPLQVVAGGAFDLAALLATGATVPAAGNGELMAASFAPFRPKVRYYWDASYFYEESDGIPDRSRQPNLMVGITSWQQQVPLPTAYFSSTTNGTNNTGSLGYQQPNYWKIPLVPVPAASPISLTGNFLRGAVALGSDGVPIFNPRNNTGQFSYAIGELDAYGGHCGLGDDYHYHIFPVHLTPVLGNDKPIAWGLDGYPVYGYVEPDGTTMQVLDADGGHDHGDWGYHYHARGTFNAANSTWTPASPYMMSAMHGAVVNFDSQIDPQPTGSGLRGSGTGGYTAQPVAGAVITAFKNPVALSTDGSGHLVENVAGVPTDDQWLMRYTVGSTTYDICWRLNRNVNPKTMTITWRHPSTGTTTTTYNNAGNRITTYAMAAASQVKLPDTSQTLDTTGTPGEDADYTLNAQSFTDNGDGTVTDNMTGLMWQKVDNGESTWENAVTNAAGVTTGGHTDWRLPTPSELFSIFNHDNGNPALNATFFPSNSPAAGYWWTSDLYGASTTNVWCANSGAGLGPKPKTETLSAGGVLRYHARYVRGAKPTNGHNYLNNNDGTVTDLDTGLMWTQVPGTARAWNAALSYAEGVTSGGFSDWRLPNIKELQTLTDYARASATGATTVPCINRTLFPAATANAYWSSTTLKGGTTTEAWVVEFGVNSASTPPRNAQGIISYGVKTETYPVFAVRTASLVQTDLAVTQNGAALTDGVSTVNYGGVNVGFSATKTFTITNNGTSSLGITGVTIDGASSALFAITASPAASLAAGASTTLSVQFNASSSGAKAAALHIASSDSSVGSAFDINLIGTGVTPPPAITNVTTNPSVPGSSDTPYITATVTPGSGASITGVQLTYNTGAQVTGPAFQEVFSNGSTGNGLAGAMNTWTATAVRAAADVRQRGATGNHTAPIVLSNCTTNGTTTITCASTTGLIPGMLITGPNIVGTNVSTPATVATTVTSITSSTTFVVSQAASGSGSGLSLTAAGVSLTGCSLGTSPTINSASTTGLAVGMGIAATAGTLTTSPPNPTVASLTNATSFSVGAATTVTAVPATLTASGTGLDFSNGTASYTDTMASTSVPSASTPTAGNVEFWVRNADLISNNGWTFQISPDGGTTWNTRLSENFASKSAANCTLNATTTVICSDTSGLTVGNSVQGNAMAVAACSTNATTTVTTANTSGLVVGMFISGPAAAGIPATARVTAINSGVSFTMSVAATATAGPVTLTANWLPANATISAITPNVSFTLNAAAFASASGITLSAVNHGFQLKHYDLVAADMSTNMQMRFQYSGYAGAVAPARVPTVDLDDIVVTLTTGAAPATLAMFDDGLHGDGAAGDGVYGVQLPAQVSGTTVSYAISATDNSSGITTLTSAGSYTTGQSPVITSATTLPNAAPNVAYSTTLAATGGAGGYGWSLISGTLPTGLTLSGGGVISGTTTSQGIFNVTLKVTDSAGRIATKACILNVTTVTAPNIVFIVTDDQGWGDVSYHTPAGQVPVQTPNMERIGTEGIRLEKFYATPVCATTRCSLLTGRSTLRTNSGNQRGVSLTEHMMPETFKAAGYQTFMCGKWHLGGWGNDIYTTTLNGSTFTVQHEGPDFHPHNRGWDFHYGQYGGAIGYFSHTSSDPGLNNRLDWWLNGVSTVDNTDLQGHGGYSTDLLADRAVTQIVSRDKSKPMLLYLAFNGVHAGVQAPASFITKYQNLGVTDVSRRTLCAAVECMDVAMGRVLSALDSEGIANNTIVVYLSDNGGNEPTGSLNDPLRGTKTDSYDGGIHTPAAIRWPGVLASGITSNQYVWVGDLFPTLCAAVGVTPQNTKPFDGINLWPALQSINSSNPDGQPRSTALVVGASVPVSLKTFTDPVNGGTKMYKLIRTKVGNTVTNELFNMTDDPYETADLLLGVNAAAHSTIVTTLTAAITNITVENYTPYIGPTGISQSVEQGSTTTLYAPFTSYGRVPSVQWRKDGANVGGATSYYQITDDGTPVAGVYMATLTLAAVNGTHAANYDVIVTSANGSTTSTAGALTVLKPVSTQNDGVPDAWKLAHGMDPNSTALLNGPLGDMDGDGVNNLLEYAFNGDPQLAATSPVRGASATKAGDGLKYLEVSYPRRIGAVDLAYTVEVSDDLITWPASSSSFETVGTVLNADGVTETVTVRVLPAMTSATKKFVRLKVTAQ